MKTIVITRKYWGTGRLLSHYDGKMCCLGFACVAYGMSKKNIEDIGMPSHLLVGSGKSKLPTWLLQVGDECFSDACTAAQINDDAKLTMPEKEEQLKPLFAKHGIRLVFRGKA